MLGRRRAHTARRCLLYKGPLSGTGAAQRARTSSAMRRSECTSGSIPSQYRESSLSRFIMFKVYDWPGRVLDTAKKNLPARVCVGYHAHGCGAWALAVRASAAGRRAPYHCVCPRVLMSG